jgi:hypothetical protein
MLKAKHAVLFIKVAILAVAIWLLCDSIGFTYYVTSKTFDSVEDVTVNRTHDDIVTYQPYAHTHCSTNQSNVCVADKYNVFVNCTTVVEPEVCSDVVTISISTTSTPFAKELKSKGFSVWSQERIFSFFDMRNQEWIGNDFPDWTNSWACDGHVWCEFLIGFFMLFCIVCGFICVNGEHPNKEQADD